MVAGQFVDFIVTCEKKSTLNEDDGNYMYFFMQFFMFTKNYEFWHDEVCLDLVDGNQNTKVKLYTCHGLGGNQKWEHEKASC